LKFPGFYLRNPTLDKEPKPKKPAQAELDVTAFRVQTITIGWQLVAAGEQQVLRFAQDDKSQDDKS